MKKYYLLLLLVISIYTLKAQLQTEINYFNCMPPPADSAVIFAPGIVSLENRWEEKICFSPDGKEMFFGRHHDAWRNYFNPRLMHAKFENGAWSEPDTASFSKSDRIVGWPVLSLNGTRLFMEEVTGKTKEGVMCQIVYAGKQNDTWSELKTIIPDAPAIEGFGLAQITDDSTLYFYSRYERIAYSSKIVNGKYSKPEKLSFMINPAVEFFVSPQNDYFIFKPIHWANKFHISYRQNGAWSIPIPLSTYFKKKKGWDGAGGGPYVSPDNKYFFFFMGGEYYWVKTDFIEALRPKK